jgi:hypothetical protein
VASSHTPVLVVVLFARLTSVLVIYVSMLVAHGLVPLLGYIILSEVPLAQLPLYCFLHRALLLQGAHPSFRGLSFSHPIIRATRTTIAAPTPIPAFAPVDKPPEVDSNGVLVNVCVVSFAASTNSASSVFCHITITPSP